MKLGKEEKKWRSTFVELQLTLVLELKKNQVDNLNQNFNLILI
jgi:hypothetical protein